MANKTTPTADSVADFLDRLDDPQKRADSEALVGLMQDVTGHAPTMWGPSIVGFGNVHYRYESGREGDTFVVGFSPRKQNLTLYLPGYLDSFAELLSKLGKHTTGKGCLYLKRLSDADPGVLRELLETSVASSNRG
jgi:hypothetical protein